MTADDVSALNARLEAFFNRVDARFDGLGNRMTRVETLLETETDRCPHREAIARAANNAHAMQELQETVKTQREQIAGQAQTLAKYAVYIGIAEFVVMGVLGAVLRQIGVI